MDLQEQRTELPQGSYRLDGQKEEARGDILRRGLQIPSNV